MFQDIGKKRSKRVRITTTSVGAQGPRPYMEDTLVAEMLNKDAVVFGVFDGHGGGEVATMCAKATPEIMRHLMRFESDPIITIRKLYAELDSKTQQFHGRVGATAAVVFLKNDTLVCSNCGDSFVMIKTTDGQLRFMSQDHKVEKEKQRVEALGGQITYDDGCARINRGLNIARSIGDNYVKNIVISDPYIATVNKTRTMIDYVLVASDGLWDVYDMHELDRDLTELLKQNEYDYSKAIHALVNNAYAKGSMDNITVLYNKFQYDLC